MERESIKRGAPPKWESPEEIEGLIDAYFKRCEGVKALDEEGNPIITSKGNYVYIVDPEPLTITGLALAIGFNSRQSLLNYKDKPAFVDTITRAKAHIEHYAEKRLYDKEGSTGAKFNLANNFKGWKEKQETEISGNISVESYLRKMEGDEF